MVKNGNPLGHDELAELPFPILIFFTILIYGWIILWFLIDRIKKKRRQTED